MIIWSRIRRRHYRASRRFLEEKRAHEVAQLRQRVSDLKFYHIEVDDDGWWRCVPMSDTAEEIR